MDNKGKEKGALVMQVCDEKEQAHARFFFLCYLYILDYVYVFGYVYVFTVLMIIFILML